MSVILYILFLLLLVPILVRSIIKSAYKKGMEPDNALNILILSSISFFVDARILFVLLNYSLKEIDLSNALMFWDGGFSIHGGMILAGIVASLYLKFNITSIYKFGDIVAPLLALSISVARIGCFLRGCCFGRVTSLPWAITYAFPSPAYVYQYSKGLIGSEQRYTLPVHPTQLYEAGFTLLLSFWLFHMSKKEPTRGKVMWTYILGYAMIRLFNDRIRGDVHHDVFGIFSPIDMLNITLILIASIFLFFVGHSRY